MSHKLVIMTNLFKTILFSSLILCSFNQVKSQVTELATIDHLPNFNVDVLEGMTDQEGNICLYYYTYGHRYYNLYDFEGNHKATFKFKASGPARIIKILPQNGVFTIYYMSSDYNDERINVLELNSTDSSYKSTTKIRLLESYDEKLVNHFESNNHLYFITHKELSNQIIVKAFSGEETFVNYPFEFNPSQLNSLSSAKKLKWMDEDLDLSIPNNTIKEKVYYRDSIIYITLDDYRIKGLGKNNTEVLKLDLIRKTPNYMLINSLGTPGKYSTNSYLLDSLLFRLSANPKQFVLSIYKINNAASHVKSYFFGSNDEFTINDDRIKFDGFVNSYSVTGTKEILKKLSDGDLSITARYTPGPTIKLLIGSYLEASGVPSSGVPGGISTAGTFRVGSDYKMTSFTTTLSLPSLEKTTSRYYNFDRKHSDIRSEMYLKNIDFKLGKRTTFYFDGHEILAYVNKNEKYIKVVKLN